MSDLFTINSVSSNCHHKKNVIIPYTSSIYFCHSNFPAADPATAPGGTTGTSSSKGSGNAIGALALGGLAALALSQLGGGGLGGGYGGGYGGSISPREQLYLRQATAY